MQSMRFGLVAIAICGFTALGARIQVSWWQQQAAELADRQEVIGAHIVELRNAMTALVDLETGQRGYLLTGDETYLRPYEAGSFNLDPALHRLAELFRGDPPILAQIDDVAQLAHAKQEELARAVALRKSGDAAAALAIVMAGEGERLMQEFRDKTNALTVQFRRERAAVVAEEAMKYGQVSLLDSIVILLIMLLVAAAVGGLSFSIRRLEELQMRREKEAMHDALTALPNRRYLGEWLNMAIAAAARAGDRLVLLYFDLDGFKGVNDRLGHEAGDRVLQATAERLRGAVRSSDFVARLGGDEFVAVLPGAPPEPALSALLARLSCDLGRASIPALTDGEVSASIGIACYPADGDTADALLNAADRAMYAVKEGRRTGRAGTTRAPVAEPVTT
jgi:diguanylate cyclase (GGDEF)-like protein